MLLDRHVVEASRGVPWQLFNQVRGVFIEMLRRHHVVLSIFMANGDAQLPLSLNQRVLVSIAQTAAAAVFFIVYHVGVLLVGV
jgi:hypothetical protein